VTVDDKGLPASVAGLFGTAAGLFARRFPLYATLTVLAISVQYAVDTLAAASTGLIIGLDLIVGAFIAATVSIGVAFDIAQKDADWSRIITAASLRWGVVTIVTFVAFFVQSQYVQIGTQPAPENGYGFIWLPFIVLWGAVTMGTVVAAIEPAKTRLLLPLVALGKGMAVSTHFVNLARLALYSLLLTVPLVIELFINHTLAVRHITIPEFWTDVPIDMIFTGPLQALATVLYIDFLRRAKR
jgi:hypothetical protein